MSVIVERGSSPVILGMPHVGTNVPDEIKVRLNDTGRLLTDADWHVDDLYAGLLPEATVVRATFHRYVIDANRDPSGASLYPGQNTTTLIPMSDFDGAPIWGEEISEEDRQARIKAFHKPYHDALRAEIERVKAIHGIAVLFDCHSIRSHIPFLFEGKLPDFNIGTDNGKTCAPEIEAALAETAADAGMDGYSHVVNGRFRGGWTTRHYGEPEKNVHAIQLELAQSAYLKSEALPFDYDAVKAERLRAHLGKALQRIEASALSCAKSGPKA